MSAGHRIRPALLRRLLAAVTLAVLATAVASAGADASAGQEAPKPHWQLEARAAPTQLPLDEEAAITVTATNLGDAEAAIEEQLVAGKHVAKDPIVVTDRLPKGVEVVSAQPYRWGPQKEGHLGAAEAQCSTSGRTVTCTFQPPGVLPYETVMILIRARTSFVASEHEAAGNEAEVAGSDASPEELTKGFEIGKEHEAVPFGVEPGGFAMTPETDSFEVDEEAGAHPFQLTTKLNLDQTLADQPPGETERFPSAPALQKNVTLKLPPGLIGNITEGAVKQCTGAEFGVATPYDSNYCPPESAIGVAVVTFNDPIVEHYRTDVVPIFNLEPAAGEPARFGFTIAAVPIIIETLVRTGEDYGVTVNVSDTSEAVQVLGSTVTFWGVPGDERHNQSRGWECLGWKVNSETHVCNAKGNATPTPYLTLPTACGPLNTLVSGEAWNGEPLATPGSKEGSYPGPTLKECQTLEFNPSIGVEPGTTTASSPTELTVNVEMPQQGLLKEGDRSEADIKETTLALPPELEANPGSAGGLKACPAANLGFNEEGNGGFRAGLDLAAQLENNDFSRTLPPASPELPEPPCLKEAKIGDVKIVTPLLKQPLVGSVYLAEQDTDPFTSPLVIYVVAQEPTTKTLVKLAGETQITEAGQLVSVFRNTPQSPFTSFTLDLFKTERATQSTPAHCGPQPSKAEFVNWSSSPSKKVEPSFAITSGPGGGPCPGATLPFTPSFATKTNEAAGSFTPFKLTIERPDGDAALKTISMQLPPGLAAVLASVPECEEPGAAKGECPAASQIGRSIAKSGLGGRPYELEGKVYLTGPYDNAPFGLVSVTEANKVGPFNVGTIVVRSTITVNEFTTAATINTEAGQFFPAEPAGASVNGGPPAPIGGLPEKLDGVPSQIKALEVYIEESVNGKGFEFNPTNCEAQPVTGTLTGYEGTSEAVSSSYQARNCASLPFSPKLTATVKGKGSKADGTTFTVTLESAGIGQANIHKVDLTLPEVLPSRQSTIEKACLEKVFDANPASCDEGSVIGEGTVYTPVFKNPLKGPAYLVSHGAAAFPDVEFVLQGEGVTIILDGKTDIKKGITYSKFETSPDAPFTKFISTFPEGPHSALTAYVPEKEDFSLCNSASKLLMPTTIVAQNPTTIAGQNGAVIEQTTHIALEGCGGVESHKEFKVAIKRHSVKGSTLTLVVVVPTSGRLSVSGSGLRTLKKSFSKAGTYTLKLHLGPKGQAAVAHKRRLEVRVHLSFAPTTGIGVPSAVSVKFA